MLQKIQRLKSATIHLPLSSILTRGTSSHSSSRNLVRLKWHLQVRLCAPLVTGCVVGGGGTAEEGQDPWKEVEAPRVQGGACGERSEDEDQVVKELHREGNEEGTSFLEVEKPTLGRES